MVFLGVLIKLQNEFDSRCSHGNIMKYRTYDVLKNRHTGDIIRLLPEIHLNGSSGVFNVHPTGYVNVGDCSPEHWEKISLFRWYLICIPWIIKQFCYRYQYNVDKYWGMVDIMSPSDYWKTHNQYKEIWEPVQLYGYLNTEKKVKVVDLPNWREVLYNKDFEQPLANWLIRRLKHLKFGSV